MKEKAESLCFHSPHRNRVRQWTRIRQLWAHLWQEKKKDMLSRTYSFETHSSFRTKVHGEPNDENPVAGEEQWSLVTRKTSTQHWVCQGGSGVCCEAAFRWQDFFLWWLARLQDICLRVYVSYICTPFSSCCRRRVINDAFVSSIISTNDL